MASEDHKTRSRQWIGRHDPSGPDLSENALNCKSGHRIHMVRFFSCIRGSPRSFSSYGSEVSYAFMRYQHHHRVQTTSRALLVRVIIQPTSHPMFNLKRKRLNVDDADPPGEDDEEEIKANYIKRRRRRPIESGFAALTLSPPSMAELVPPDHAPDASLIQAHTQAQIFPSQLTASAPVSLSNHALQEEPAASLHQSSGTTSQEVQMKTSSWYEPEKDRKCVLLCSIALKLSISPPTSASRLCTLIILQIFVAVRNCRSRSGFLF